jgi:FkbH-like protein
MNQNHLPDPGGALGQAEGLAVAQLLGKHREMIALALFETGNVIVAPSDENPKQKLRAEVFFIEKLLSGRREFGDTLFGDKARALRQLHPSYDLASYGETLRREMEAIREATADFLSPEQSQLLETTLNNLYAPLAVVSHSRVNVLFVGDCLGRELQCFLYPIYKRMGVDLNFVHLGGRTEFLVRKAIQDWEHEPYDLIFYSPFTHDSMPNYSRLAARPFLSSRSIRSVAYEAFNEAISIVQFIRVQFPDPPLFVHNSSFLLRELRDESFAPKTKYIKPWLKKVLTRRARHEARESVNELINEYVRKRTDHQRIHILDEYGLVRLFGEEHLARYLYYADDLHPSVLGQKLAHAYETVIAAQLLSKKKVFVTDLDNTLWMGTVGDGAVEHLANRQRILKRLRQKGFLLAISSKNEAENISWSGAELSDEDFSSKRINWLPKAGNIHAIATELNLNLKEFVFIDDMAVERTLVERGLPGITVLDGSLDSTWATLDQLARLAVNRDGQDRTKLYREKKLRDDFLSESSDGERRHKESLKSLALHARVSDASNESIGRVVELINRTNQFNINGSRVTETMVRQRLGDPTRRVLCVEMRDRFGDSGLVCCALLAIGSDEVEIESFVLSCRAFGFGIETALVNVIKAASRDVGVGRIVARFKATERNQACRNFLPAHSFIRQSGELWCCNDAGPLKDPEWLTVESTVRKTEQARRNLF